MATPTITPFSRDEIAPYIIDRACCAPSPSLPSATIQMFALFIFLFSLFLFVFFLGVWNARLRLKKKEMDSQTRKTTEKALMKRQKILLILFIFFMLLAIGIFDQSSFLSEMIVYGFD